MNKKSQYPQIEKLGLTIITKCPDSIPGIDMEELKNKLTPEQCILFNKYFGCQTIGGNGPYVYDVEAVLERMASGKLIGTQLFPD